MRKNKENSKENIYMKLKGIIKRNKNFLTYIIFFFIATVLWFINALRKDFTTEIKYPIHYSGFPSGYTIHSETTEWINIRINGSGYDLLPYFLGKNHTPLNLSVLNFKTYEDNNYEQSYMLSEDCFKSVSARLPGSIQLLAISPDTLKVELDKVAEKSIALNYIPNISFKSGYEISDTIKIIPDSVRITGPAELIDTLTHIDIIGDIYENTSDSIIITKSINIPDKTRSDYDTASVTIPIDAFIEKKLHIPITSINVPDSLELKTFPAKASITCRVSQSRFNEITEDNFEVIVDFLSYKEEGLPQKLKVKLSKSSNYAREPRISPLFVDCLFEKKQEF